MANTTERMLNIEAFLAERRASTIGVPSDQPNSTLFNSFVSRHGKRLPYRLGKFIADHGLIMDAAYLLLLDLDAKVIADHGVNAHDPAEMFADDYHRRHSLETIRRISAVAEIIDTEGIDAIMPELALGATSDSREKLWHKVDATASDLFDWHKNL